jgi:hypothetical protein
MLQERGRIHRFTVRPGAAAEGEDLVGRDVTVERLLAILQSGSCHLRAPRRYGKTSILRRVAQKLTAAGKPSVYADLSPGRTVTWLLVELTRAAQDAPACCATLAALPELSGWPERDARVVEKTAAARRLEDVLQPNPWSFARRLLEAIAEADAVLLLDEFSVFLRENYLERPTEIVQLTELLAEARKEPYSSRQVLAGSAGLSSFARFHGLGKDLQDLGPLDVTPLSAADAAVLAEELLYGARLLPTPEARDEILRSLGEPVPYFLHAFVNLLAAEIADDEVVSAAAVRRAYSERMLGNAGYEFFKWYSLRDRPYPAPLREGARGILKALAAAQEGVAQESLRNEFLRGSPSAGDQFEPLLSCLQEDFDLIENEGRWLMRSKVLRDRWALGEPALTRP